MRIQEFVWIPGEGINSVALARMREHFPRPSSPMGEAWLMSDDRQMFDALLGDLARLEVCDFQEALQEILSGFSCFGLLDEWHDWYHYLLGVLLPRCHEDDGGDSLVQSLVAAFIARYPDGINSAPYKEFSEDVLLTLGQCMMEPVCWHGQQIVPGKILHRLDSRSDLVWYWQNASGDFSASMFFCLKYLPESLVPGWFNSVLAIKSPCWRAQLMVWLLGAEDFLSGKITWPSELIMGSRPSVDWDWSHCLRPEMATRGSGISAMLSPDICLQVQGLVRDYFNEERYLDYLLSIAELPWLEAALAELPDTFAQRYVV